MLKIGTQLKVTIPYLNEEGIAEINHQGNRIYVKQGLPREEVMIKVVKQLKNGYVGDVCKVMKRSDDRVSAKCPIYESCGSCQLLHVNYEAGMKLKKQMILSMVKKSKVSNLKIGDIVGMDHPYQYRNKMIISFAKDRNRQMQAGFYEENSHRLIPFQGCLLHEDKCDKLILDIISLVKKMNIEPYDEDRRRGLLRHVLIRRGVTTDQTMVVLVVASSTFPARKNFMQTLLKMHPEITTIIQNVNNRKTSVVIGDEERVLYGPGYVEDDLCGLRFRISSKSFYQINHEQTQKLYDQALAKVKWTGNETVIDAYSGIGTIGMCVSKHVKEVLSVESNKDAVQDAIQNAKRNQIKNIRFICDDAGSYMQKLAASKRKIDVVIIDPPRSGSDEKFLSSLVKLNPKSIIYISCNPKTQIRDMEYLKRFHYETDTMDLFDQFPMTMHVESIVRLTRVGK